MFNNVRVESSVDVICTYTGETKWNFTELKRQRIIFENLVNEFVLISLKVTQEHEDTYIMPSVLRLRYISPRGVINLHCCPPHLLVNSPANIWNRVHQISVYLSLTHNLTLINRPMCVCFCKHHWTIISTSSLAAISARPLHCCFCCCCWMKGFPDL